MQEIFENKNAKLISINYLKLHNLLPVTENSHKFFCRREPESLAHIFFPCQYLTNVREGTLRWLREVSCHSFDRRTVIHTSGIQKYYQTLQSACAKNPFGFTEIGQFFKHWCNVFACLYCSGFRLIRQVKEIPLYIDTFFPAVIQSGITLHVKYFSTDSTHAYHTFCEYRRQSLFYRLIDFLC